jgi:hypothetical protein
MLALLMLLYLVAVTAEKLICPLPGLHTTQHGWQVATAKPFALICSTAANVING